VNCASMRFSQLAFDGDVDQFDVVSRRVVADAGVGVGGQVRAEVVQDDRQSLVLGIEGSGCSAQTQGTLGGVCAASR
jgi:hypothetical protein